MKAKQSSPSGARQTPEEFIEENLRAAKARVDKSVQDATAYAQLYPGKALLWAAGGGYLLRILPVNAILGAVVRLVTTLLKPAVLIYGVAKLWQKAQPVLQSKGPASR